MNRAGGLAAGYAVDAPVCRMEKKVLQEKL